MLRNRDRSWYDPIGGRRLEVRALKDVAKKADLVLSVLFFFLFSFMWGIERDQGAELVVCINRVSSLLWRYWSTLRCRQVASRVWRL